MTPSYSSGRSQVYFYYTRTSGQNGADECSLKRVSAPALEDLIAERLKRMGRDEAFLKQILTEADLTAEGELAVIEDQRAMNIVSFVAQGRASEALARELEQLEGRKAEIEAELERIDLEAREVVNRTINARAVQEGLGLFDEIWENATPEERKELMRYLRLQGHLHADGSENGPPHEAHFRGAGRIHRR